MQNTRSLELQWMQSLQEILRSPPLDQFFIVMNYVDTAYFSIALIAIIWYLFNKPLGTRLIYLFLLSSVVNQVLKTLFHLPRPCILEPKLGVICLTSYTFPSGAAQTAALIMGITFLETKKATHRLIALLFGALLAFSRIYLGVHFPTDILAGLFVGFLLVYLYHKSFHLLHTHPTKWIVLFPILLLILGQSRALPQATFALGIGLGLLINLKPNKTLLELASVLIGTLLLYAAQRHYPSAQYLLFIAVGAWFSALASLLLQKLSRPK